MALKPDEIAYELFRLIVRAEKPGADMDGADRDWVLSTYRACLETVRGTDRANADLAERLKSARERVAKLGTAPEGLWRFVGRGEIGNGSRQMVLARLDVTFCLWMCCDRARRSGRAQRASVEWVDNSSPLWGAFLSYRRTNYLLG